MKKYLGEIICILFAVAFVVVALSLPNGSTPPCDCCQSVAVEDISTEYSIRTTAATVVDRNCHASPDECVFFVESAEYSGAVIVPAEICENFDNGDKVVIDILTDENNFEKVDFVY
ncbi:MAG: hypothetical protein IKU45_02035 [Clostridia bacterium]|nr:hypothetical protein [Clostridia bacterium]